MVRNKIEPIEFLKYLFNCVKKSINGQSSPWIEGHLPSWRFYHRSRNFEKMKVPRRLLELRSTFPFELSRYSQLRLGTFRRATPVNVACKLVEMWLNCQKQCWRIINNIWTYINSFSSIQTINDNANKTFVKKMHENVWTFLHDSKLNSQSFDTMKNSWRINKLKKTLFRALQRFE